MSSWSEGPPPVRDVLPLCRIRVLLLSPDRRFLRVTAFLLRRRGLAVETAPRPDEALSLVERHRPDVVVLDGNGSVGDAVRALARLETLRPAVAVLVVSDDAEERPARRLRLLPKWSAAHRLADEVERAYLRLEPA